MKNYAFITACLLLTLSVIFTYAQFVGGYQLRRASDSPSTVSPRRSPATVEFNSPGPPEIIDGLSRQRQILAETDDAIEDLRTQLSEIDSSVHPDFENLEIQATTDAEEIFFVQNPSFARQVLRLRMAEGDMGQREATIGVMYFWGTLISAMDLDADRRTRIIDEMIAVQHRNQLWGLQSSLGLRDFSSSNQESPYSVITAHLSEEEMETFRAMDQAWGKRRSRHSTEADLIRRSPELNRAARSRVIDVYDALTSVPPSPPNGKEGVIEGLMEYRLRQMAALREQLQDGFSQQELNGINRFISAQERTMRVTLEMNANP